jgi:hypothetical protein
MTLPHKDYLKPFKGSFCFAPLTNRVQFNRINMKVSPVLCYKVTDSDQARMAAYAGD